MDVTASNRAINDGTLPAIMKATLERLKPEASYFGTMQDGRRTCFIVFDMKDPSEMPSIAEPFYMNLNATVEFSPVMNAEDLQKGLEIYKQTQVNYQVSMAN
jgi:hypothetical protein